MFDISTILKTREKYIKFISEWPEKYSENGKNFKDSFLVDEDFPLWWLTKMHQKDPEGSLVFYQLCLLENGVPLKAPIGNFKNSILIYFLRRLRFLFGILLKSIIFKLFYRFKIDSSAVLFASVYGTTLKITNNRLLDRYYLDLPDNIQKDANMVAYYFSFYSKSVLDLIFELRSLRASKQIVFCERYLQIFDIISAFSFKNMLKYILIERKHEFRRSFNYHGQNLFWLFKNELRYSMFAEETAMLHLLSNAINKIVKKHDIGMIISFLELYPYSCALYYGAKKANTSTIAIAYQHAIITPAKTLYFYDRSEMSFDGDYKKGMPMPDYFIFQGSMGRDLLVESGYPQERCFLTGSPRFDKLADLQIKDIKAKLPANKKIVIIATSNLIKDTEKIIQIVAEVINNRDDCFFIFKPHPNWEINKMVDKINADRYVISNEDIHQLILMASVLITSYSTTADEAIALGCPAVSIDTGVLVNMSSFTVIEAAPTVTDPFGLNAALDMIFYHPEKFEKYKNKWPELIAATFYKIDGKAQERVVQAIKQCLAKKEKGLK